MTHPMCTTHCLVGAGTLLVIPTLQHAGCGFGKAEEWRLGQSLHLCQGLSGGAVGGCSTNKGQEVGWADIQGLRATSWCLQGPWESYDQTSEALQLSLLCVAF